MKRSIKQDYLSGDAALRPFYSWSPQEPNFEAILKQKSLEAIPRSLLVTELLQQNQSVSLSEASKKNIELLGEANTFSLTTGHQLVLLGGPMFTLYKILTVIRLAEDLKKLHGAYNFVPVFWLASEDHDWEEVNHYLSSFTDKQTYAGQFAGAVGQHILNEEIQSAFHESLPELYKKFYTPGKSLALAFRELINHLFQAYGLVIIDGDSPALKQHFAPVVKEELTQQSAFHRIHAANEKLTSAGYPVQVGQREINLFYLKEGLRERIIQTETGYALVGSNIQFTQAELLAELETHPENFSPNALLRPLYQEMLLPNLAYSGGWGELSYWMQLKGVFEHYKINFPFLLPRMSATLFTAEQAKEWKDLGFDQVDILNELHELNSTYLPEVWDDGDLHQHLEKMEATWTGLIGYLESVDPTLAQSATGEKVRGNKYFEKLYKKIGKSIRVKNPIPFQKIADLKAAINPERKVQERVLNFTTFAARRPHELVSFLYSHCAPLEFTHQFLTLHLKSHVRKSSKQQRNALSREEVQTKSQRIFEQWKSAFPLDHIEYLHLFMSIQQRNEVETELFTQFLRTQHPKIKQIIPVVDPIADVLKHVHLSNEIVLEKSEWGIPEPKIETHPVAASKMDMILLPMLAFDDQGNRIGYGKGHYDRFLSQVKPDCIKIGLCFELGRYEGLLAAEPTDIPLDFVITEDKIYKF